MVGRTDRRQRPAGYSCPCGPVVHIAGLTAHTWTVGEDGSSRPSEERAGSRHHYLPASYIGRFSFEKTGRLRRRPVWVRRKDVDRAFVQSAENVAFQNDLYRLPNATSWLGSHIDAWSYEGDLPLGLNDLIRQGQPISARRWLTCLVPFVSGLFVRGPEANQGQNNEGRIIESSKNS
jgi:hypothetical protein